MGSMHIIFQYTGNEPISANIACQMPILLTTALTTVQEVQFIIQQRAQLVLPPGILLAPCISTRSMAAALALQARLK